MYCLIFIGIGLVSLVAMFLQVKHCCPFIIHLIVMMYCLIFIGIGLVSLVAMFLQVIHCCPFIIHLIVMMYCLIFIGIGLVSLVTMFLQVVHVLSNLYLYQIGQLSRYVLTGNTFTV